MADLEKTVAIIFRGDDQLSKTVRDINRSFGDFGDIAQTVASPLASIAEGVLKADAALAALAVGGMALAIREAGNFGDSFNEIATLIDAPAEELGRFKDDIVDYAKDSTASFESINAAIYTAISYGTDYADSLDVISRAEKLSIAGKADLEATVSLLSATMNAYGASVEEAERYSDAFFTTVRDGKTTIPELAQSLSKVTGAAATAGVPIEDLLAAVAALTAAGDPTSVAMTKLQQILSSISKPTSQAASEAERLGINFNLAALKSEGLAGFLKRVYDEAGGSAEVLTKLFGSVEAYNGAVTLGADKSGIFQKALEDMAKAAGATEAAYRKMAENFGLINQTLANNVRAVLLDIGNNLLSGYLDVAKGVIDVLKSISKAIDDGVFDSLFREFDLFAEDLAAFLKEVAKAVPEAFAELDFSGFLTALRSLGNAIGGMFDDVDLSDADDLAGVLQEIIDTGEALIRVTTGMAMAFQPYFEALRLAVGEVNSWDAATQEAFGKVLLAAEMVVKAGTGIGLAMAAIAESGFEIQNVFNVVFGAIQAVWNTLQVAFDTIAWEIVDAVYQISGAFEEITGLLGMDELNQSIRDVRDGMQEMKKAIEQHSFEQMGEAIGGASRMMRGFTGDTGEARKEAEGLAGQIDDIPERKEMSVEFSDAIAREDIEEFERYFLDKLNTDGTTLEILPIIPPDGTVLDEINRMVEEAQRDVDDKPVTVPVDVDTETAEDKLERFKIEAELISDKLKYQAEVDIAMAQEATKRLEAAFASVNVSIQSTGETLVGLFGQLGDVEGISNRWRIEEAIDQEIRLRQQAFDLQSRLVNSTIELNKAQSERLESGDAFFTISTEGLTPALEQVLIEIVERIQMQVIASGDQALIDLSSFTGI